MKRALIPLQKKKKSKPSNDNDDSNIFNINVTQQHVITLPMLISIIKLKSSLNTIKAQILNLFYFHTNLIQIDFDALELLVRLNDTDINEGLRMSMKNLTSLLNLIIENNNILFFIECINDKTKEYNRISILCKIAQTNLNFLDLFVLDDKEINYILRIALVHINTLQLKNFIIDNMNKLDRQQILEMATDYNNKDIVEFMLIHATITRRVLYLSIYHEELFKILYSKIDKNILNIKNNLSIIDKLELQKIKDYKKELKFNLFFTCCKNNS